MRKAKATLGCRRMHPASPPPKHLQLRETLLELVAAEQEFCAPIPSRVRIAHREPCP